VLVTAIDRPNAHGTDNVVTRTLLPQWECYLTKRCRGGGGESDRQTVGSASMYGDHPRRWLTRRVLKRLAHLTLMFQVAE